MNFPSLLTVPISKASESWRHVNDCQSTVRPLISNPSSRIFLCWDIGNLFNKAAFWPPSRTSLSSTTPINAISHPIQKDVGVSLSRRSMNDLPHLRLAGSITEPMGLLYFYANTLEHTKISFVVNGKSARTHDFSVAGAPGGPAYSITRGHASPSFTFSNSFWNMAHSLHKAFAR